jgi:ferrous iron transport protein B
MATPTCTIALAGNPNCGKSTIFNALTGAHQHVGNWPGKTVEKKEGHFQFAGHDFTVIDLPGTYSLNAFSPEEIVTRNFIIEEHPNVVVSVIDSANLERNLYLVVQLLEIGAPLILALNMADIAAHRHIQIDRQKLSERLGGIPVVSTIGSKEKGMDELKAALLTAVQHPSPPTPLHIKSSYEIEAAISHLEPLIAGDEALSSKYLPRWLATKLLEADEDLLTQAGHNRPLIDAVNTAAQHIEDTTGEDAESLIADRRYAFIAEVVRGTVQRPQANAPTRSDRIDRILTHHIWGLPFFMLTMWIVFQITANVSTPFLNWVDATISGPITRWALAIMKAIGLGGSWIEELAVDGVIAGVGGVLVFVPVLVFLYVAIAMLEDTGYMARAAFVMDRFMQKMGLHGKSFLPMLVGFGCNVPAIYATRTLENDLDRKITGFLSTFMSCGARLPIYVIFGTAFFGSASGTLVFAMYATGILVAVLTSLLLTRLVFRGKPAPLFVMELPPYRLPNARNVFRPMWHRLKEFLRNAGTVILAASMFIWLLLATPVRGSSASFSHVPLEESLFGAVSKLIAPAFGPAGFNNWGASGALVTGFVAKEAVISTLSQIYTHRVIADEAPRAASFGADLGEIATSFGQAAILTVQEAVNIIPRTINLIPAVNVPLVDFLGRANAPQEDTALEAALHNAFTPLSAVAFNVFVLLYIPCMATTAVMRQEFGVRWMGLQMVYMLSVAWLAATLVYQIGLLLGFS